MSSERSIPGAGLPWTGDERERARYPRSQFWLHLRPARVSRATLRWSHTMGLGGSSLVLLLLLAGSGVLQLLVYEPSLDGAWTSVRRLEHGLDFGSLVRGIHYWAAQLLLLVVGLHAGRVLFTGAFRAERRVTWWTGLALLLLVATISFTGYLLPLDQRAWWAVTISTRMVELVPALGPWLRNLALGGETIDTATLVRFTTFHTTLLPLAVAAFAGWHFWRVRRARGVIPPPGHDPADRVTFFPSLFVREASQAALLVALVVVLAAVFGAPLGEAANPGLSPDPVKAPWYFVGLQELLIHLHPLLAMGLLPLVVLAAAGLLPWLAPGPDPAGRWFLGPEHRRTILVAMAVAGLLTAGLVVLSDRVDADRAEFVPGFLVPALALGALGIGGLALLRRATRATRDVLVVAALGAALTAGIVLTIVGQFFRGAGMALRWPG